MFKDNNGLIWSHNSMSNSYYNGYKIKNKVQTMSYEDEVHYNPGVKASAPEG